MSRFGSQSQHWKLLIWYKISSAENIKSDALRHETDLAKEVIITTRMTDAGRKDMEDQIKTDLLTSTTQANFMTKGRASLTTSNTIGSLLALHAGNEVTRATTVQRRRMVRTTSGQHGYYSMSNRTKVYRRQNWQKCLQDASG